MSAVVPPPPPPPGTPLAGQATLPVLVLKSVPPAVLQLPAGSQLEAVVVANLGGGAIRLRFATGMMDAQTPFRLAEGATLSLAVPSSGPANRMALLAVNGRSFAAAPPGTPQVSFPHAEAQASQPGPVRGGPERAVPGAPAAAMQFPVRGAAPGLPLAVPAVPGRMAEGSPVTLTLLRPPPAAAPGQSPAPAAAATVVANPIAVETVVPNLPAGTTIAARVVAVQLPGQPPPDAGAAGAPPSLSTKLPAAASAAEAPAALMPLRSGSAFRAEVTGSATGGNPVVQTHAGPMVLETAALLPKGSILTLTLTAEPILPAPPTVPSPFASRAAVASAETWPALNEVLTTLDNAAPVLARAAAGVVPRPDGSLMAATVGFLAALRTGAVPAWLGEAPARALSRLRPELAEKIDDDAAQLNRAGREAGADGWRTLAFPLLNGPQVEMVRLFLREHAPEEADPEAEQGDRFVLDVRLSRLGRIQMDGLFRPGRKRLDLIVRTERPFTSEVRDDIRQILRAAHEATGIEGAVAFQSNPPSFVELAPEPAPGKAHGILV